MCAIFAFTEVYETHLMCVLYMLRKARTTKSDLAIIRQTKNRIIICGTFCVLSGLLYYYFTALLHRYSYPFSLCIFISISFLFFFLLFFCLLPWLMCAYALAPNHPNVRSYGHLYNIVVLVICLLACLLLLLADSIVNTNTLLQFQTAEYKIGG